jgi:alpha-L-rhamnosidase
MLGESRPRLSVVFEPQGPSVDHDTVEFELRADSSVDRAKVLTSSLVALAWPFSDLRSRAQGQVRTRLLKGETPVSTWSDPVSFISGLLDVNDWTADFVTPGAPGETFAASYIFKDFELSDSPVRARLWSSAQGVYEVYINGTRIGSDELAPGWSAYQRRLRYQTYDVTPSLTRGKNTIDVLVGNGWYRGQLTYAKNRETYGDSTAALAQLEILMASGDSLLIATDPSWSTSGSFITFNDLYDGEHQNLLKNRRGDRAVAAPVVAWDEPRQVEEKSRLVGRKGPSVKVTDRIRPISITSRRSGSIIVDFGQNLVGRVRIAARSTTAGQVVEVRHAEVLVDGELALTPLRSALATCRYELAGRSVELLEPHFTFSGFRYAQIDGIDLCLDDVEAVVIGTDLTRTADFACSHDGLNRLHANVVWSARGNFLDLPTDCPQRDERLGWTGDIQVFAPSANTLFDTSDFLAGWLEDLAAEQLDDGSVPPTVPDVLRDGQGTLAAGWGDAAVVVPTSLAESFGDSSVLERQYRSMTQWIEACARALTDGVWFATGQFGDWLDPDAPPEDPGRAKADQSVVATAYFIRSARLLSQAAAELGNARDSERYAELAANTTDAFVRHFVSDDGLIESDCQTVYALAISFELLKGELLENASARLLQLVRTADHTISTGFLGTPHILDALCKAGYTEDAFRMATQRRPPSWLYSVEMGATTIWERWDSLLPDGTINPGSMTSFNHYAYGAIADWMHRAIAGVTATSPAYTTFDVRPLLTAHIDWCDYSHITPLGPLSVQWSSGANGFELRVLVPYGAEAAVYLPNGALPARVGYGAHEFHSP